MKHVKDLQSIIAKYVKLSWMDVESDESINDAFEDEETFSMPTEDVELEMDLERVREEFPDEFGTDVEEGPLDEDYDYELEDSFDGAPTNYMEKSQESLPSTIYDVQSIHPEDIEYLKEIGYVADYEERADEHDNEIMVPVLRRTRQYAKVSKKILSGAVKCHHCNKSVALNAENDTKLKEGQSVACPSCGTNLNSDAKQSSVIGGFSEEDDTKARGR